MEIVVNYLPPRKPEAELNQNFNPNRKRICIWLKICWILAFWRRAIPIPAQVLFHFRCSLFELSN